MKLLLIRHGETVDNIAGLYAGVRDSALTNYGVEQTNKLGDFLARNGVRITHIFASPLSRAFKTAEAIREAQVACQRNVVYPNGLDIFKVPALIEQDFGFYEGKPLYARSDFKKTGRESHYQKQKDYPGFVDVESKESMAARADDFLDNHLLPLLATDSPGSEHIVAVASHGMLLSHLWRRLLLRLPRKSLTISSEVMTTRDNLMLEHLGGWSNTGYLELNIRRNEGHQKDVSRSVITTDRQAEAEVLPTPVPPPIHPGTASVDLKISPSDVEQQTRTAMASLKVLEGCSTEILAVDSKHHLVGLKRQRGGIGSSAHDEGQKKLDGFFKKQRQE